MRAPAWLEPYMQIPFKEHGRDFSGVDCWGLVKLIYECELGIELPTYVHGYDDTADSHSIGDLVNANRDQWIKREGREQPFDLILIYMQGLPWHLGLVVARGLMVHASEETYVAVERYTEARWVKRIEKGGFHVLRQD